MKNETKENFGTLTLFTTRTLEDLIQKGFHYVKVNAFTHDRRLDYITPQYFILVPYKEFASDITAMGIYEPIESDLLKTWAASSNEDIRIFIALPF